MISNNDIFIEIHPEWEINTEAGEYQLQRPQLGVNRTKSQLQNTPNPPASHSCSMQPLGKQHRDKIRAKLLRKGLGTTKHSQPSPTGPISLQTVPSHTQNLLITHNGKKRQRFCCQQNSRMKNFLLPQRNWSCDCKVSVCFPVRMGRISQVTLKLGSNPWRLSTGRLEPSLTCANHVLLKDSPTLRAALS